MEKPKNGDSPPTDNGLQQMYHDSNAELRKIVTNTSGRSATEFRDSFEADRSSPTLQVAPQNQAGSSSSANVAEDVILEAHKDTEARKANSSSMNNAQGSGRGFDPTRFFPNPDEDYLYWQVICKMSGLSTSIEETARYRTEPLRADRDMWSLGNAFNQLQVQDTVSTHSFNTSNQNQAGPSSSDNYDTDREVYAPVGFFPNPNEDHLYSRVIYTYDAVPSPEEAARARLVALDKDTVKSFEEGFDKYMKTQNWIRPLLAENEHLMCGVYADDFEKSLIKYNQKYKDQPLDKMKDKVEQILKGLMTQLQDGPPQDKAICQKIKYLLDSLDPLILQDVLNLLELYPSCWKSKFKNEYMDLLFNPKRTPLTFHYISPDVRPENLRILENPEWSQDSVKRMLKSYVDRQSEIRVGYNLNGVVFEHVLDRNLNHQYFNERYDFCANMNVNWKQLTEMYEKFWKWQRDMLKQFLKTDQDETMVLHIHLSDAMAHHSLKDPYLYVLLFDVQQLANVQQQLYGTPTLFQLTEHTKHYFHMIFGVNP